MRGGVWLKEKLNQSVSRRFAELGYSEAMASDAKRETWWWLQARGRALARQRGLFRGSVIVWTDVGRAELVAIEVPRAGHGEVSIETLATTVSSGTERAQYLRLPNTTVQPQHIPGYSGAGRVIAVGRGVREVHVGDLVAGRGLAHASVATLPASDVYRLPRGVSVEDASALELGVIVGQGIRLADIRPGEAVCVIGAGLIGLLAQRFAVAAGAGDVTAVARSERRERLARAGGARRFLVADAEEIAAVDAPVVIEATGDPLAINVATVAAAHGARVVLLGSSRGAAALPVRAIRDKALTLIGAHVATLGPRGENEGVDAFRREAEAFLDLLARDKLRVDDLMHVVDPREADAFYRQLAADQILAGARFDWTRLPQAQRCTASGFGFWRLPDPRGRGVEPRRTPLLPGLPRVRRRGGLLELADPFAGASGGLRVGLLGCGDIASHNAAALAEAPNAELTASFDLVRELADDLAATYGGESVGSADELFERSDVDAVLLSVPHHLHLPLGLEAIAAGKHVIVEKPLANDLAAAVELVEAADQAGVVLSVCFPHRYQPNVTIARRLVQAGALGELAGSMTTFFVDKPASYWIGGYSGRSGSNWRQLRSQAGGGVLIMNLSHYVDLVRHVAGIEAECVTAVTSSLEPDAEIEDSVTASVRYSNGALGSILGSGSTRGYRGGHTDLALWGSHGHVVLEPDARFYTLRALDGLRTTRWQSMGDLPEVNIRAIYMSRLATAIDRGERPDVTGADGIAVQAFLEAAYQSDREGRAVRPDELVGELAGA